MEWINSILIEHSVIQAVVVIAMISALGLALGKISVYGVFAGGYFCLFCWNCGRTFRLIDRSPNVELCREFRIDYFCLCLGIAGRTWFSVRSGREV